MAAVGRSIYLFGGVFDNFSTGENLFHADLYRFVTTDNRWERIETTGPRPAARAFAGSGADPSGRRFFVYGGASYGPGLKDCIAFDDLWVYSERDSRWTKVEARNEGPSGRSRPSTWLIGHTFYVFGGVSEKFVTRNDLWALDLQTLQWKRLIADGDPGSPPPRHEAQSALRFRHGKLLIYGGESIDPATGKFGILNDTWEYDIRENRWTQVAATPSERPPLPRNYSGTGLLGSALYIHGGDIPGGRKSCGAPYAQNVTSEIWSYDLKRRIWTAVASDGHAPLRLKRHRGAEVGNRLYFFSGFDFQCDDGKGPGQIWNLDVYSFDP